MPPGSGKAPNLTGCPLLRLLTSWQCVKELTLIVVTVSSMDSGVPKRQVGEKVLYICGLVLASCYLTETLGGTYHYSCFPDRATEAQSG